MQVLEARRDDPILSEVKVATEDGGLSEGFMDYSTVPRDS